MPMSLPAPPVPASGLTSPSVMKYGIYEIGTEMTVGRFDVQERAFNAAGLVGFEIQILNSLSNEIFSIYIERIKENKTGQRKTYYA